MRGVAFVALVALAAAAAAAVASSSSDRSPAHAVASVAEGSFDFENSRDGTPIFKASGIGPGDDASGTVEIANEGDEAGELTLRQHDVVDTPGAGGGLLSGQMSMRIRDVSDPSRPQAVYDGPLAPMPALELGPLGPGQSRAYEFDARLADGGTPKGAATGDNAFQGAAISVGYSWTAAEGTPAAGSTSGPGSLLSGPPGASSDRALQLVILRIRAAVWHRRLVLWAYCGPGTCQVLARLRFRVLGSGRSHRRALGLLRQERLLSGSQKLVFKLPHRLRRALRAAGSKGQKATVSVVLVLLDRGAHRVTTRDSAPLHHLYPGTRHRRP